MQQLPLKKSHNTSRSKDEESIPVCLTHQMGCANLISAQTSNNTSRSSSYRTDKQIGALTVEPCPGRLTREVCWVFEWEYQLKLKFSGLY